MHCPNCGLEQFGEGTVCYNCGAKLHSEPPSGYGAPPPGPGAPPPGPGYGPPPGPGPGPVPGPGMPPPQITDSGN